MQRRAAQQDRQTVHNVLRGTALLGAAACLLAGCGGSSSSKPTGQSAPGRQARLTHASSGADTGTAQVQRTTTVRVHTKPGSPAVHPGHKPASGTAGSQGKRSAKNNSSSAPTLLAAAPGVHKSHAQPTVSHHSSSPAAPKGFNPCRLVSVSEARSITRGLVVSSVEAPLGPSCIYGGHRSRPEITLSIQTLGYSSATRRLANLKPVTVGTRRAACGRLGQPMLYVPLSRGRVLNVTAPCAVARRFATLAVSRLAA